MLQILARGRFGKEIHAMYTPKYLPKEKEKIIANLGLFTKMYESLQK